MQGERGESFTVAYDVQPFHFIHGEVLTCERLEEEISEAAQRSAGLRDQAALAPATCCREGRRHKGPRVSVHVNKNKAAEYDPGAARGRPRTRVIKDQYRHCKPLLVMGDGLQLLEACGIAPSLPSGEPHPRMIVAKSESKEAADGFVAALAKHRHYARETDPPRV